MPKQKSINLALQGGGAHGAFTWGVLDKLLEDGRIDVEAICGTSAGAMNASAMAYGLHLGGKKDGKDRAREMLQNFWEAVHQSSLWYNPVKRWPWEQYFNDDADMSWAYVLFDSLTRSVSPYQFNPFDINPLRDLLEKQIDFDALAQCEQVKLFISTTHVATGKVRVFETKDITSDVVMASACLPFLFKAVEIDGEAFWDGGYTGNPSLFPLFYKTESRDIMMVHVNPMERPEMPISSADIMNRINEISFNSSLIAEMRSISFVKKLIDNNMLKDEYKNSFKNILLHSVRADKALCDLGVSSKFKSDWEFLTNLRDRGRETMADWLDRHYDKIGKTDSIDIQQEFLYSLTHMFQDLKDKKKAG